MNKAELISVAAEKSGLSKKDTEKVLTAVIESVSDSLASGEKVSLVGFGVFDIKDRPARTGRNPRTKEPIEIPAAKLPVFKPGKALKDKVDAE